MRQFEVLYALKGEAFWLVEIKRLDLPEDAPKSARFAWLKIDKGAVSRLTFESRDAHGRTFAEGRLNLTDTGGDYVGAPLINAPLPLDFQDVILAWLAA